MIEVELPDGSIAEFPDGTPPDAMKTAIQKRFPVQKAAEPAANAPVQQMPQMFGGNIAFADRAIDAIPIAGPFIKEGIEQARGQLGSMLGMGTPEEVRAKADAYTEQAVASEPVYSTAGTVFGTAAPLAVAGLPALGARALGMSGGLASRVGFGAGSGALISGADSVVRAGPGDSARQSAMIGGALGGALPLAGAGGKALYGAMIGKPIQSTEGVLARAMADDKLTPDMIAQRLEELGPDAVLADLGPNLQRQAAALASLPGESQKAIVDALTKRAAARNSRIITDVNSTLGPAPTPSRLVTEIKSNMDALSPEYRALFEGAKAVDTSDIALSLDGLAVNLRGDAQQAVKKVRSMLNVAGENVLDPNPYTLFQTRQAIDGLMEMEANSKVIGQLSGARSQIDEVLAQAVPGIKAVDARFAELARQTEAVGQGQQVLDSGRTAVRPDELAQMVDGAPVQGEMVGPSAVPYRMAQGVRAEIERIIGTTANDLNALKTALKGDGSWNRDRLATLYGQGKADKLLDLLEREKLFSATEAKVMANSETAGRTAAQREFEAGTPGIMRTSTLTGLAAEAMLKTATLGAGMRQNGLNSRVAAALMGQGMDPAMRMSVERALASKRQRALFSPGTGGLMLTQALGQ